MKELKFLAITLCPKCDYICEIWVAMEVLNLASVYCPACGNRFRYKENMCNKNFVTDQSKIEKAYEFLGISGKVEK